MTYFLVAAAALFVFFATESADAFGKKVALRWGGPAETAYATGFAHGVRKHADGGVCLFDMALIENDAAGSGRNEEDGYLDYVWGPHRARKILTVDMTDARRAFLIVYTHQDAVHTLEEPAYPLDFTINGYPGQVTKDNTEVYRWVEFPVSALKSGDNTIELCCADAKSREEGWRLYLSFAEDFKIGGGDPAGVGMNSFHSDDEGKTWRRSPFGPDKKSPAEYSMRLSLDQHLPTGTLETPVIDLWRGDTVDLVVPLRRVVEVIFEAEADVPPGTRVTYFARRGTDPSPYGKDWSDYEPIGDGAAVTVELAGGMTRMAGKTFNRRYVQFKAELATDKPTATPIVRTLRVRTTVENTVTPLSNVFVTRNDNPVMLYPSVDWEWESWDRPEFEELRKRENLDAVLAGARTQFQSQVRLMDHAYKRWRDGDPFPEYPAWDALSILDRVDKAGAGGMCIQSNNFLAGLCRAYGWQARHVNIIAHEICEVWSDDYGKWVYLDGHMVNHYLFDKDTGEPLSILDMHRRYLDKYHPDGPIDWMKDFVSVQSMSDAFPVGRSSTGPKKIGHNGFTLAAFARMVPRTNWCAKPFPRPITHGCSWWPWNGYINWYDERTPPKKQYSWHTDREQDMWPVLNRVHVHAVSGVGDDRLFLRFETYTPNFSRYEVEVDGATWAEVPDRWVWLLQTGPNHLRVRAVNKQHVAGKPSVIAVNRTDTP
jgi:hypothetical protein